MGFFPIFNRKSGIYEYLLRKYSNSPRPSATPLINAGGKIGAFSDSLRRVRLLNQNFLLHRPALGYISRSLMDFRALTTTGLSAA